MHIILSSAGRRVYLVQWFQEALRQIDPASKVYVLDANPSAAAIAAADGFRQMPAFTSEEYANELLKCVDELKPALFLSLNDYELTILSLGLSQQLRSRGIAVPVLDERAQRTVADKLEMYQVLAAAGVTTPKTVLLSDRAAVEELLDEYPAFIVKDRWGSGSSGLRRFNRAEAVTWLAHCHQTVAQHDPIQLNQLILQPDLGGVEHGLDIISSVTTGPVQGVLARRKLGMRNGETAAAITVDSSPFQGLAAVLNAALGIRGTVDVDLMLTDDGVAHVIDINPRFGGGYPFSHIAGANTPHFMLASTLNIPPDPNWNRYRIGYVGAKHEGIIGFESSARGEDHAQTVSRTVLRKAS